MSETFTKDDLPHEELRELCKMLCRFVYELSEGNIDLQALVGSFDDTLPDSEIKALLNDYIDSGEVIKT